MFHNRLIAHGRACVIAQNGTTGKLIVCRIDLNAPPLVLRGNRTDKMQPAAKCKIARRLAFMRGAVRLCARTRMFKFARNETSRAPFVREVIFQQGKPSLSFGVSMQMEKQLSATGNSVAMILFGRTIYR